MSLSKDKGKKQLRNIFLAIIAFTFLLYGNSIKNEYALDDNYVAVTTPEKPNNPRIEKGIKGIPEIFTSHYIQSANQSFEYRPLVLSTFAIEYQFFGSNPHISHFINVLLYALTCILLFLILRRVFKNYAIVFPLLITFLFLAHPIHTEVVSNIKCRDELLSFLFGLCALHFFMKRSETNKWLPVFYALFFLFIGLLCKKTAALFIILIPLATYFFTDSKLKKTVLQSLLFLLVYILYNLMQIILLSGQLEKREFSFFENPLFYEPDFFKRIPLVFYTLGYYFRLLVFPYPLSCYYGYNTIPMVGLGSPLVIVSAIFHIGIGVFALIKFPQKNILSYSIIIYFIGIFPFANLVEPIVGIVGERFVYFASLGFCIMGAYFMLKLFKIDLKNSNTPLKANKPSLLRASVIILIIYSALTISRNNKWKNIFTLFRNDVENFQNSCTLHNLVANTVYPEIFNTPAGVKKEALIQEASFHYRQAAQLMIEGIKKYPNDYITLNSIGIIYINIFNDAVTAQPFFKKSIALNPNFQLAQYNFAFCYEKKNLPDSAIVLYEKMILSGTKYPPVFFRLHELYLQKQEYSKAIICDEKATKENPEEIKHYVNLGNAYILNKDTLNGLKYFEKAASKSPNDYNLMRNVANAFKATGNKSKSALYEQKAALLRK